MKEIAVVHVPERARYEIRLGEETVGYAAAQRRGGVVTMPHVEIAPAHRGQDLASRLVRGALDDIRAKGERVLPLCPFVVAFLRRNAAYRDLIA